MRSPIQQAISQTRPFSSPGHEAAVGLILVADRLKRRLGRVTEPHGITGQQYNVLRILRGAGKEGLPTLTIAERMIDQTPGITRLLDRLERKHLVRRERCETDRRQVLCWITPAGLKLLDAVDEPVRLAEAEAVGALRTTEHKELVRLLSRLLKDTPEE